LGSPKPPIGNLVRHILIILSFLLLSSPVIGQTERPETIIVPVSGIGDVSNTRKLILENTLTDELKKHFRIVPQEKYEQVLEQVFQELEYEECSEDTCIMRVQEMLQVENVFNLQIIGEGKDSQLNLKWITLDEKKNEEDYCEGCGTGQLRKMIGSLVEKLVGVKRKGTGILYRDTPYSKWVEGGKKWFRLGDEKTQGKYEGEIETGVPDGQGTITFPDGRKYVGEYKDGDRNGQGTSTYSDGNVYVGEFKDGKPNGQGTDTFPDGGKYVGEFNDGKWDGQGTITYPDGSVYVGEYKDGEFHGQGTYTSPNGSKYVGEWKDGKFNGQGKQTFSNGDKYKGEFKDGEWNGQGTFTSPDGQKYVGGWKDGLKHGQGTMTLFKGGESVGKYVGEWKDGKWDGQGTLTLPDGRKFVGKFRKEKPWNITVYDKNGNIIGKIVNGVKQ